MTESFAGNGAQEVLQKRGCLSKLGLKDRIKTGQKGVGGGRNGGKKCMEVGILLQRGGWPEYKVWKREG